MKNIYIDMDGTLADFQAVASEEELFEQGYFANLKPQQNVIDAVKELIRRDNVEVYILSAVLPSPYAQSEKNEWLNTHLPELDAEHRIFVPCGEDKGKYIGHTLGADDLLLDDYSKNLHSWCPPGRAIKLMNDINGNFGTWRGARVSMHQSPTEIANTLCSALGLEVQPLHFYNIIKQQPVEHTGCSVVMGYNPTAAPPSEAPYCCWVKKGINNLNVTTAFSESEALIAFYDRVSDLERSVPQLARAQVQSKEIPIREQLAKSGQRVHRVKAPVSRNDRRLDR